MHLAALLNACYYLVNFTNQAASLSQAVVFVSVSMHVKRVFECSQKMYAGEQGAIVVVVPFYFCTEQPAAKETVLLGHLTT